MRNLQRRFITLAKVLNWARPQNLGRWSLRLARHISISMSVLKYPLCGMKDVRQVQRAVYRKVARIQ